MFRVKKLQCLALLLLVVCPERIFSALIFRGPEELRDKADYDFIIAGGGTAGIVVASRLSENPQFKILVIEAGPSNEDIFETRPPGVAGDLKAPSSVSWNFTLSPQVGLNGRSVAYPRGRVLGGCSSVNGMYYTRGSQDDWNSWSRIIDADTLSWDKMLSFIRKAEVLTQGSENQPEKEHIDPSVHGRTGKVSTSAAYSVHPFNDMLIETTKQLPDEFPFKLDMNDGRPIGISWSQYTVDHNGERSSSATGYLAKTGNNVHVLLNTYVTRVLPVSGTDFRVVEFAANATSLKRQLTAKREVIISGGVIGSPQMLLNSGIGDRKELQALGIPTIMDNPSVGKNFSDQPFATMLMETTIQDTDYNMDAALAEWNETGKGPIAIPSHMNHRVFVRLPHDAAPFSRDGFRDPTPGKDSPHIEMGLTQISTQQFPILFSPLSGGGKETGETRAKTLQFLYYNLHPVSRGSISLSASDPFAQPAIDPKLLSEDLDIAVLREAIRSARRLFSAPVFQNSIFQSVVPPANATSDEDLNAFLRSTVQPGLHGVGSAAMSPRNDNWGVVDPDFRVKGTSGLRVVDASIIPTVPSGHTQAPVYGIAELASVLIAREWI